MSTIEEAGFNVVAMKKLLLSKDEAKEFYLIHQGKPFYDDLVDYMSSGPVVALVLEKNGAVMDFRKLIGATDPSEAAPGTIRARWGESIRRNVIHGSDCAESATTETTFLFTKSELNGRIR